MKSSKQVELKKRLDVEESGQVHVTTEPTWSEVLGRRKTKKRNLSQARREGRPSQKGHEKEKDDDVRGKKRSEVEIEGEEDRREKNQRPI